MVENNVIWRIGDGKKINSGLIGGYLKLIICLLMLL